MNGIEQPCSVLGLVLNILNIGLHTGYLDDTIRYEGSLYPAPEETSDDDVLSRIWGVRIKTKIHHSV